MEKKRIFQLLLAVSILLLTASLTVFILDYNKPAGVLLISGFIVLALAVRGFTLFKGFSFTLWIFTAVTLALLYPAYFVQIGSFELKRLMIPLIQIIMFGMGSQMSLKDFSGVIKMPKGVIVGILLQYTIMPFVGFFLAVIFKFPAEIAAGILLIGCAPSGVASNVMSYIAKANLALAVTLASIGTILSPLVTPFLMKTLAGQFIEINFWSMMIEIINMIILPIIAGLVFRGIFEGKEKLRNMIIQIISYLIIIFLKNILQFGTGGEGFIGFGTYLLKDVIWFILLPVLVAALMKFITKGNNELISRIMSFISMFGIAYIITLIVAAGRDSLLQVGFLLVLASLIHNLTGYFLGYNISRLLRMPEKDCRTIAFEVGMQNGGLASGLALQMGKIATVGLGPAVFGPMMNITGSSLATWWRNRPIKEPDS